MTIGLGEHHNVQAMAAVLEREASSCNKWNTRKHPRLLWKDPLVA